MAANKTRIEIILEAVDRATGPINERLKATETRMAQFRQSTDRISGALTGFGTAATASGVAVLGMLGIAAKKAADMETLSVALTTAFQGNEAAAKSAFAQIQDFAARTPYQMEEVMRSFIKLKNMGLDPSQSALESYGNTASAMGKSLNDMIEAVADAATGEFERLKEFGIKAKSQGDQVTFTFRGVSTTVQKNAEQIERYLMKIGQTEFAGGMERQSKTINGQMSTLRDNLDMTAATIGKIFIPAINDIFAVVGPVIERIGKFAETNQLVFKMAAGFGVAAVALGGFALAAAGIIQAVAVFKTVAAAVSVVTLAVKGFSIALWSSPITWFVAGAAAIAGAAYLIYKNWEPISEFFGKMWDGVKNLFHNFASWLVGWVTGFGTDAGSKIVTSIEEGISAAWSGFIKRWEERIQKLRNYLPFSPAKEGPLKDIHRVQLVETIAKTITPKPLQQAMDAAMLPVKQTATELPAFAMSAPSLPAPAIRPSAAPITISYAPQVTINGATPESESNFRQMLQQHKQELIRILNEQTAYKNRVSYA